MYTSVSTRSASAYKRVAVDTGVQSADPHQLVGMLYDGLLQSLHQARGAMNRQDLAAKGSALIRAIRILEEGLKAGLNPAEGGELAQNLRALYDYSVKRLTEANLRNDEAAVAEIVALIEPLAQSWKDIRGQVVKGA